MVNPLRDNNGFQVGAIKSMIANVPQRLWELYRRNGTVHENFVLDALDALRNN